MNYKKAYKFLNNSIIDDFSITRVLSMYSNETLELISKLKNKLEIRDYICDINNNEIEKIEIELELKFKKLDVFIKKDLYNQVLNCTKRYKIIYIIIENDDKRHINILLIDNEKKRIERFDTIGQYVKIMEKITEVIVKKLKLNYEIIHPNKYIFSSIGLAWPMENRKDCGLCVPLSLLFIYLKIKYDLSLCDIIRLLSSYNNKKLFSISTWFINYLKSV
jgi:hypothetical protein